MAHQLCLVVFHIFSTNHFFIIYIENWNKVQFKIWRGRSWFWNLGTTIRHEWASLPQNSRRHQSDLKFFLTLSRKTQQNHQKPRRTCYTITTTAQTPAPFGRAHTKRPMAVISRTRKYKTNQPTQLSRLLSWLNQCLIFSSFLRPITNILLAL